MNYNPKKKVIQITPAEAELAVGSLENAMRHIRLATGLPLDKYKREGALSHADHAQKGILDACEALGIDFADGARWGNEIDLREKS